MILLQGTPVSKAIKDAMKSKAQEIKNKYNEVPKLVVILVGNDSASEVYVGHKVKACKEVGIDSEVIKLSEEDSPQKIYDHIDNRNKDNTVHGILVQLPLPSKFDP